jgi:predicted phosphoribosyltransferase
VATSLSGQNRALSDDEKEFVAKTKPATMADMSSAEIHELRKHLSELRGKARDELDRHRRAVRGKAPPHGASVPTTDRGLATKERALSAAMKRVNRAAGRDEAASRKAR